MNNPAADWVKLYDRFYSKREIYEMLWSNINLYEWTVAAAPFGGPVALVRASDRLIEGSGKPKLFIFTAAGKLLASFIWERSGRIVKMGWSADEFLVVVQDDGSAYVYNIHGTFVMTFSAVQDDARLVGIEDCIIWDRGLVVLTTEFQLFSVDFPNFLSVDAVDVHPRRLIDPGLLNPPTSWTIVEPQFTLTRNVEVLIAAENGTVYVCDALDARDMELKDGPFTRMSVSPTGKMLAMLNQEGSLMVLSTDFQKNLSQFDTNTPQDRAEYKPAQLVWCGPHSVVLYWSVSPDHRSSEPAHTQNMLLMVGPFSDWIKYQLDGPVYLVPEVDGIRIIGNEKTELLQKVPNAVEEIFKPASTFPAAMLYEAMEEFEKRSCKSDELIRAIKADLPTAVDACIEAAGHEFSNTVQRRLLKAAAFGKAFLDFYAAEGFVSMCRTLRVLNAVRFYQIGMPITYQQFQRLSSDVLISRLINRHHHLLALRICEYLKLPTHRVLVHWACSKIRKGAEDDPVLCEMIVEKLREVPGISYVEIADTAYSRGHQELATMLLNYEPCAAKQVPPLLRMNQDDVALEKAIESGDTDLVYYVLLEIKDARGTERLFEIVRNHPAAGHLLATYLRSQDLEGLKNFFYQGDQMHESANIMVLEAYRMQNLAERLTQLKLAIRSYGDSGREFEVKATKEEVNLIVLQEELEQRTKDAFIDLSLTETIYKCTFLGHHKDAKNLKDLYKVPDKRFWWTKIRALAEAGNWEALERFAESKKSPIGYEPFAQVCIDHRPPLFREAAKYIPRVTDARARAQLFITIGSWREAAESAFAAKDLELLEQIEQQARASSDTVQHIRMLIAKLTK